MPEPDRRPIGDLLTAATVALTVEPGAGDSAASMEPMMEAVMEALWRGFCVAGAAGELLGICADPDTYPPLWHNAQPVLAAAITALRRAPSLPAGLTTEVNPAGGPDDLLDDDTADRIRAQILMLAAALNTAAALAARRATDPDDTQACRIATTLASELHDCYTGQLRSFLNHARTSFGPGSFIVRGRGRRNTRGT